MSKKNHSLWSRSRTIAFWLVLAAVSGLFWWLSASTTHQDCTSIPIPEAADEISSVRLRGMRALTVESSPEPEETEDPAADEHAIQHGVGTRVFGWVVDSLRCPVPGASAVVRTPGRKEVRGKTDLGGYFEIDVGAPPLQNLVSTVMAAEGGRVAWAQVTFPRRNPVKVNVHTLVLGPTAGLTVKVLEGTRPVAGARVNVSVVPSRQLSRVFDPQPKMWSGWGLSSKTDHAGIVRFPALPHGDVRIWAQADGPLTGETATRLPNGADEPVALHLRAAKTLTVSVVAGDTKVPLEGIRLRLEVESRSSRWRVPLDAPDPLPLTNADGIAIVYGVPADKEIMIWAMGAGWVIPSVFDKTVRVAPDQTSVRLEIPLGQRISWEVASGDCPAPVAGSAIRLEESNRHRRRHGGRIVLPVSTARLEGRQLIVDGVIGDRFSAIARRDDGCIAELEWRRGQRAPQVMFRRPGDLAVLIRDELGTPVAGVGVYVRNDRGSRVGDPVLTDEEGRAMLKDLLTETVFVGIVPNIGLVESRRVGVLRYGRREVNLSETDRPVAFTLPPLREAVVRILTDGQAGFPSGGFRWGVLLHPETLKPHEPPGAVYDAERGEIRFPLYAPWPGQTAKVYFSVPGMSPILQDFQIAAKGGDFQAELRIEPPCSLVLRWNPKDLVRDSPPYLERRSDDTWSWFPLGTLLPGEYQRGRRVVPVSPGVYRLHAANAEAVSPAVVVSHSGPTQTLLLPQARDGKKR